MFRVEYLYASGGSGPADMIQPVRSFRSIPVSFIPVAPLTYNILSGFSAGSCLM
jgi:hypothetical protein